MTGTTPGGTPTTVLPATTLATTGVFTTPVATDQAAEGMGGSETEGGVTGITGRPAGNTTPSEADEPFDPPADSNAGSPGADVENPADDSYTRPRKRVRSRR